MTEPEPVEVSEEVLQHFDLSLPQHRRRFEAHQAALERIAREDREQAERAEAAAKKWNRSGAQCGTESGYNRHRREGEEICRACAEARRVASRLSARRRRKKGADAATAGDVMRQEMSDPERMSCCGAPIDDPEKTKKYEQRHRQFKTAICDEARACVRMYSSSGRPTQTQLIEAEKQSPDRADCCGAPYEWDGETTKRYRKRHNRADTPTCRWASQAANGGRVPEVGRNVCCGAPKDGGEQTQKYAWRHKQKGTAPCWAARECRNSADRKSYRARRVVDDTNQRRRERRGWRITNPGRQMPCCGAPIDGGETSGKYAKRHHNEQTEPCWAAKECRNRVNRKRPRRADQSCV